MKLNDGTILMHDGAPYDPVKAHEYYIKTRKLKGRKKGTNRSISVPTHTRAVSSKSKYTVRLSNGKTVTLTRQQLVEQQAYAAKRVTDIKKRLIELTDKLRTMLKEAEKKKANSNKKPTVADKHKAAQKAKQYRQKHKQQLATKAKNKQVKTPPKKTTTSTDPVVELKSKITEIRTRLKDAINVQRELTTAKLNN